MCVRGKVYLIFGSYRKAAITLGLFSLVAVVPSRSQATPATPGTPPPIKVVSASQVIIRLDPIGANFAPITAAVVEDFTPCLLPDPKGAKYTCTAAESSGQQPVYKSTRLHQTNANPSGVYMLASDEGIFAIGRLYRLTLQQTDPISHAITATSLSVDTSPSIAVGFVDLGSSNTKLFRLMSTLGFVKDFTVDGTVQKTETVAGPVDCVAAGSKPGASPLTVTGTVGGSKATLTGWKMRLDPLVGDLSIANPTQIGTMAVCMHMSSTDFTPDGSLIANAMNGIESSLGPVTWTLVTGTKMTVSAGGGQRWGGEQAERLRHQPLASRVRLPSLLRLFMRT